MSDVDPFAHPPREVTDYLAKKGLKESFSWRDFSFDEHAHSFTVAKSTGYDILGDVKGALSEADRKGLDFAEFQKLLRPTLEAKGWWGRKTVVDPLTGEKVEVELGSTRRLRTIYWANTRSAYGAGQWERAWRTRDVMPYLVYVESTAEHKRELHLSWVGTMLPIEHPWWSTHYPPSAWGCMCRVRQASQWEAEQAGYDPDAPPPDDGLTHSWTNTRTGEVERVPLGVDPGWGRNPGQERLKAASDLLAGKVGGMSEAARATAGRDLAGGWLARLISRGDAPFDAASVEPGMVARGKIASPVAILDDALVAKLGAARAVVTLSVADAAAIRAETPSLAPDWIDAIQPAIEAGRVRAAGGGLFAVELGDGRLLRLRESGAGLAIVGLSDAN